MMAIYPWQQTEWQLLQAKLAQDRLPHALLLTGSSGMGKLKFARLFAALLLCEQHSLCAVCRGCQLFNAGSHPDFYEITPQEKSKIIKIEQVRHLITQVSATAQRGGYQVIILHPAEVMNTASANALLKTLEEPPGRALFILLNHEGVLPATIVSRCQKIHFTVKDYAPIISWFCAQGASEEQAKLLLPMAEYAPLRALQLLQSNYLVLRDDVLKALVEIMQQHADIVTLAALWMKQDLALLLQALISISMDLLRLQTGAAKKFIVNYDHEAQLEHVSQLVDTIALTRFLSACQKARNFILGTSNINVELLLDHLLLEWKKMSS